MMQSRPLNIFFAFLGGIVPAALHGQTSEKPATLDIRATSSEQFSISVTVRALSGGRILVNDIRRLRIVMLDSAMNVMRVIAESSDSAALQYGKLPGGVIGFRNDSTVFVDRVGLAMIVLDPQGKAARTFSIPRARDVNLVASNAAGKPGFDRDGNLIYRGAPRFIAAQRITEDSAALLRVNLDTRAVDTVTFAHIPVPRTVLASSDERSQTFKTILNPLPLVDDWAILSDGTIGVFRGKDFTLQLFRPGQPNPEQIPVKFNWRKLSDFEKSALLDSAKAQRERFNAEAKAAGRTFENVEYVGVEDLPDYFPAFALNSVFADEQDRFWVRTLPTTLSPNLIYRIITRTGQMVREVAVPKGTELLRIGPDGSLYLISPVSTDGSPSQPTMYRVIRARLTK